MAYDQIRRIGRVTDEQRVASALVAGLQGQLAVTNSRCRRNVAAA